MITRYLQAFWICFPACAGRVAEDWSSNARGDKRRRQRAESKMSKSRLTSAHSWPRHHPWCSVSKTLIIHPPHGSAPPLGPTRAKKRGKKKYKKKLVLPFTSIYILAFLQETSSLRSWYLLLCSHAYEYPVHSGVRGPRQSLFHPRSREKVIQQGRASGVTWVFCIPIWDLLELRHNKVACDPSPAQFSLSFSKARSSLQRSLWPELSSAGAKPLKEAEVWTGWMWKSRDGNFTNLSFVCRKTWRKGREHRQQAAGQSPVLLACTTRSSARLQSNSLELSPRKTISMLPASRDMQFLFGRFAAGPRPSQRCKYWCWVMDWEQSDLFAPPVFSSGFLHQLWVHQYCPTNCDSTFPAWKGKGNHITRVKWCPRLHWGKNNEETSFPNSSGACPVSYCKGRQPLPVLLVSNIHSEQCT